MNALSFMLILNGAIFAGAISAQAQSPVERITMERGPCLGTCPIFQFSVRADGTGRFHGYEFTRVIGERSFVVTPASWAAFQAALAPYRPRGAERIVLGHARCKRMATDHSSVSVTWEGGGHADHLSFNFGCRGSENEAVARALAEAPELLPVADLIERIRLEDGEFHGRD